MIIEIIFEATVLITFVFSKQNRLFLWGCYLSVARYCNIPDKRGRSPFSRRSGHLNYEKARLCSKHGKEESSNIETNKIYITASGRPTPALIFANKGFWAV